MVLTHEQQANLMTRFGRLQVSYLVMYTKEANIIVSFGELWINWPVHQVKNMEAVNVLLSIFEGNINPRYPQVLKLYLQAKKDIEK